ncbi:CRISPR-associated helicase Cas3' [Brachybacterium muris]|uniref:CRISPR-associated helicase Cas3' n=1 Tax=Brachybacterium muris TaxID=219301 RepID=UPI0021A5D6AC|nr:CRISPR-associated helicase Cas3' [Brachybacterium muris]
MRTNSSPFGLSPAACAVWAKSGDETGWLALPQHMLDSAGVAGMLWDEWASSLVRDTICRFTSLDAGQGRTLLMWLAGVHDIGKATLTFQLKPVQRADGAAFTDQLRDAGLPLRVPIFESDLPRFPHALASRAIVSPWLTDRGVAPLVARSLADVVDAHHGIPSRRTEREGATAALLTYDPAWTNVHHELLGLLAGVTGIESLIPHLRTEIEGPAQSLLTGLVIMADWLASGADIFPMAASGMAAHDAEAQAQRIRDGFWRAGLTAPWEPRHAPRTDRPGVAALMQQRFSWPEGRTARPVQQAIADLCASFDGPRMVIVEAPTGEGKTEAALLAAESLARATGAGGAIFAAPTMSTANGLFDRVTDWAARSTSAGEITTMHLAHSKSRLNHSFNRLRYQDIGQDEGGDHGAVVARAWLSGRKKGLLSNFTVATVDQVLLMALQGKHSMLRHLGLAGKVVIIDEVHAYDTYMSRFLQMALRWLGHYGTSVVLLSATLPAAQKRDLIAAYQPMRRRRRNRSKSPSSAAPHPHQQMSHAYPLITAVSAESVDEATVEPRDDDLDARVQIIDDGMDELIRQLSDLLAGGGCALVLCNTVARAQEAYGRLHQVFTGDVELHHAAFTARDRADKEAALLGRLGPEAHRGAGRPERSIVVATQVAEQSLDIDVDLLITDIAPADLLVQRIGRLHRHERPESERPPLLRSPQVLVRGILATAPAPVFDSGAAAIYDGRLLLSTLALVMQQMAPHGFHRPSDVPSLVQTAYGESPPIPEGWADTWDKALIDSEKARRRARARSNTFMFPEPTAASSLLDLFSVRDHDDSTETGEAAGLAQVRDSDPTIEVIPIVIEGSEYRLLPWMPGAENGLFFEIPPPEGAARTLAESTVRLPSRLTRSPDQFDAVVGHLEAATPLSWQGAPLLTGQLALPLDQDLRTTLGGRSLSYSRTLGLVDESSSVSATAYRQDSRPPIPKEC